MPEGSSLKFVEEEKEGVRSTGKIGVAVMLQTKPLRSFL
jgi:hypothetical protein